MASSTATADTKALSTVDAPAGWTEPPKWEPRPARVLTKTVADGRGLRLLSMQELAFVDAMLGGAYGVPAEAARLARYADPAAMGQVLKRRLSQVLEAERVLRKQREVGDVGELMRLMWKYARNGKTYGTAQAVKSQENLARIHGLLSDKLDVRVDKEGLREFVREALTDPARLLVAAARTEDPVDAEVIAPEPAAPDAA